MLPPKKEDRRTVRFDSLPEDMQVLIEQFVSDRDSSRKVPADLPLAVVKVCEFPVVELDESDRGSDHAREMDLEEVPPILVADGQFIDGKHRLFKAREDNVATLQAIDLSGIADPGLVFDNSMGAIGDQAPGLAP